MSLLRKLGFVAIIASLSFSQAHAHKDSTRSGKLQANAAMSHSELMADIYHRALVQMHREIVELQRKCGTQFSVLPNYGAMPLEPGKR